jgi:hypothetical protein
MTFDELLAQIIDLLKRQGRVSYSANEPHVCWECRSAEHSENMALFPLVDLFQQLLQFETGDTPDEKVGKLEQIDKDSSKPLK